ncbi:hypothetical protein K432DRAFT_450347, partial [Lepidopterella palustris CBS 459.81]
LLACEVDEGNEDSLFLILVDGKFLKYTSIEVGSFKQTYICFDPTLVPMLPAFLPSNSESAFAWTRTARLPSITQTWHATSIDILSIHIRIKLLPNFFEVTVA